ncbi:MAG: archaeosortase/exosortase family protein [Verrucomicrobia bacterium]|nr:archaeosortase/exosortase family protein [Verrucomicrobiota bacterium]
MVRLRGVSGQFLAWVLAGLFWFWTFWACAGEWQHTDAYSYGFFVPLLGGYFFWRRWPECRRVRVVLSEQRWAWGLIWLAVLLAGPVELVRQTPLYWRPVLWAMGLMAVGVTLAAAFITGGRAGVRAMIFPVFFPLAAIPWPGAWEVGTTLQLQGWVAVGTGEILNWLGVAAEVDGKTIRVAGCVLGVEEACSGLQSLQSAMMVALAGGEVFRRRVGKRLGLLGWAVGVALAGNLIRAVILGLIGARTGAEQVHYWHNLLGMGILLAVVLTVWGAASRGADRSGAAASGPTQVSMERDGARVGWLAMAWLAISMGLVHLWYFQSEGTSWEPVLALTEQVVQEPVPAEVAGVLRATQGVYAKWADTMGYHFWWAPSRGNANQLYHRPDVCMPGAGWTASGQTQEMVLPLDGQDTVWTAFPFERAGQPAVLFWAVWLDGEPLHIGAYDQNRQVYLQRELMGQFIRRGKRTFSYEVAACLLPGREIEPAEAARKLGEMFRRRADPAAREDGGRLKRQGKVDAG